MRFQPGGARFALVPQTYDRLKIYDARTGTLTQELTNHEHPITTMEYSRDGRYLITGSSVGEIIIRDGNTGEIQHRLSAHGDAVTSIAVIPKATEWLAPGGCRIWRFGISKLARIGRIRAGGHAAAPIWRLAGQR